MLKLAPVPVCRRAAPALLWAALALGLCARAPAGGGPPLATPPGGTVRALSADPFHPGSIKLGTTTGVVYSSSDFGGHWKFQSRVADHDDWVVAGLAPDPTRAGRWYAALWSWAAADGGVFSSSDGGATWQPALLGHAVRGLAIAPSDPRVLVAAALDGVFRSSDAGAHWLRISPADNAELRNVESVAIDPADPQQIYVGTWHLPWKTVNGGHDWWQMRQGVIDDSDVFSISIDRAQPATVYLSACSGIYRSDNRGADFRKILGIPYTARRTPALVQDGSDPATIYAGTTEGLWVTHDGGNGWTLASAPNLSVNSVVATAGHGLLLATEHAGVMAGEPGSAFVAANTGFSNRLIAAVASGGGARYLAVSGDQQWGGIFSLPLAGGDWSRIAPPGSPAAPDDVYSLAWGGNALLAGTAHGIYRLAAMAAPGRWQPVAGGPRDHVYALAALGAEVWAVTPTGLFASSDGGHTWHARPAAPSPLVQVLALPSGSSPNAGWLFVAGDGYVLRSPDSGLHFTAPRLDASGRVRQLAYARPLTAGASALGTVFAATTHGLFWSADLGATWQLAGHGLPQQDIRTIHIDPAAVYVTGAELGQVYRSRDGGLHWALVHLGAEQENLARLGAVWIPANQDPGAARNANPGSN